MKHWSILAILLVLCGAPAHGAIVVADTLGPYEDLFRTPGYQVTHGVAFQFTATDTAFLTQIELAFRYKAAPSRDTLIEVRALSSEFPDLPGDVLELVSDACVGCNSPAVELRPFGFSGTTLLEAGQTYWLAVRSGVVNKGTALAWALGYYYPLGNAAIRMFDDTFYASGNAAIAAFRITGSQVPIPAAVWLLGSALGALAWLRRRRTAA
ncbi:MAG: VPLPA-CTERM sorting domain-containing protein [Gammaproteobacteria bacterium]|nr:MAG: VPLPA-CTERM sorting domain-containing protein [Gammaproteobacteria bacterium]